MQYLLRSFKGLINYILLRVPHNIISPKYSTRINQSVSSSGWFESHFSCKLTTDKWDWRTIVVERLGVKVSNQAASRNTPLATSSLPFWQPLLDGCQRRHNTRAGNILPCGNEKVYGSWHDWKERSNWIIHELVTHKMSMVDMDLALTKQVDSTIRVLWLVHQTRYILGKPPPDETFKLVVRFATVKEEEIRQMNEEATPSNTKSTCLVDTKTIIPLSVGA